MVLQTEGVLVRSFHFVAMTVRTRHSPSTVAMLALVHEDGLVRPAKVLRKSEALRQLRLHGFTQKKLE